MIDGTIEIWERVTFKDGEPIMWCRSTDYGQTWEKMEWPGRQIPFVLTNWDQADGEQIDSIVIKTTAAPERKHRLRWAEDHPDDRFLKRDERNSA